MIYLLRHGETPLNASKIYQGRLADIHLSETGRKEAQTAAELLKDKGITHIHTSSLSRAVETSDIVNSAINTIVREYDDLQDINPSFLVEGLPYDSKEYSILRKKMDADPDYKEPDAESTREFHERINRILTKILSLEGTHLIVTHRRVIQYMNERLAGVLLKRDQVNHGAIIEVKTLPQVKELRELGYTGYPTCNGVLEFIASKEEEFQIPIKTTPEEAFAGYALQLLGGSSK
jgi:broad specificity phosphatase PhoE